MGGPAGEREGAGTPGGLRIVGVLGGIGAGKSTVARKLAAALHGAVLDADEEAAALLADPAVQRRIQATLAPGRAPPPGAPPLDRRELARRIFGDPEARRRVEGILHPAVRRSLHAKLRSLEDAGGPRWVVLDVPLLLEKGMHRLCDFLVHVEASAAVRARRACRRHGWTPQEWAAREAAQRNVQEKAATADAILDNSGSLERLRDQIQVLAPRLRDLAPCRLRDRWPRWDRLPVRRR